MSKYEVRLQTVISLRVMVEIEDDDPDFDPAETAADQAWELAEDYLKTVVGDGRHVTAEASLDGIGADEVKAVEHARDERGDR